MKKTFTILAAAAMLTAGGIDASNIYISNQGGFEDVHLYAWGASEAFGGWPGAAPSKTVTVGGAEYGVFATEAVGQLNLIYNYSGGASQLKDYVLDVESGKDYYFAAYESGMRVVEDPEGGLGGLDPFTLYIDNNTGWEKFYVYAYNEAGAPELFGGWPGAAASGTVKVGDVEYLTFPFPASDTAYNLIFNNNNGTQYDAFQITADRDWYIKADAESAEEVTSGVKGVGIADGEAVYFNLQGERVAAPVRGLHIVVRGGKAAKVMF